MKRAGAFTPPLLFSQRRVRLVRAGFTLIELIFVVVILAVLIGIAIPALKNTFESMALDNFARELQGRMQYLSQRAIVQQEPVVLDIKTYALPENLTLESDKDEVLFYPDGTIDPVNIVITGAQGKNIILTTEGAYGKIKLEEE